MNHPRIRAAIFTSWLAGMAAALAFGQNGPENNAAPPSGAEKSWSENSDQVRVAKALFDRIAIPSVAITNFSTVEFVLTPQFAAAFLLTPQEVDRVNQALSEALHQFRTVKGQHFEPVDSDDLYERAQKEQPYPSGTFRFRLHPFSKEAAAIREDLKSAVLDSLGAERAKFFWLTGGMFLDGEMNTTNHAQYAGSTYAFRLMSEDPGPLVDLNVGTAGGGFGRPHGAGLDPYAPDKLKPILERWRAWMAQRPPGKFAWTAPLDRQVVIEFPPGYTPAKWDDAADHVDLPKTIIRDLKVPGLTDAEEISPEAIALFGLTPKESQAINELYGEMKTRMEQMERNRFAQPDPEKSSFVIRAFPEEAAALNQEWHARLKEIVGAGRAELLDHSIRTRVSAFAEHASGEPLQLRRLMDPPGPRWFDRGGLEMRIQINTQIGPRGPEIELKYESDRPESGSSVAPRLNVPKRFQHLLSPDMLDRPKVL